MAKILMVGDDSLLLQTRAGVVKSVGASVVLSNSRDAIAVQADAVCDLVVICHSLRSEPRAALIAELRQRWPNTEILVMVRGGSSVKLDAGIEVIDSWVPERLLERIVLLLGRVSGGVGHQSNGPREGVRRPPESGVAV